jgi:hypothetical protein
MPRSLDSLCLALYYASLSGPTMLRSLEPNALHTPTRAMIYGNRKKSVGPCAITYGTHTPECAWGMCKVQTRMPHRPPLLIFLLLLPRLPLLFLPDAAEREQSCPSTFQICQTWGAGRERVTLDSALLLAVPCSGGARPLLRSTGKRTTNSTTSGTKSQHIINAL